jgi:hypothetical protein
MAAPKLKMYLLPPNYAGNQDNDVQAREDDELLPVLIKQEILSNNVQPLTGVVPWFNAKCYPIIPASGRNQQLLTVFSGLRYRPTPQALANILVEPSGELGLRVLDADQTTIIAPSGYKINLDGSGNLDTVEFFSTPATNKYLSFWYRNTSLPATSWALPASTPYDGTNASLAKVVVSPSGGSWPSNNQPYQPTIIGPSGSYFTLPSGAQSCAATFWSKDPNSYYFAGDNANWVSGHMRMNPDIFIGTKDYAGDNGEVNGTPFVQGLVPQFAEAGTYQINYRDGYVKFATRVNSALTPVKANYSFLVGIRNVTKCRLTLVPATSGRVWRPALENVWPEAHGKRLIRRNDAMIPTNVYVNDSLVGTPRTVSPYEVLQIKMS